MNGQAGAIEELNALTTVVVDGEGIFPVGEEHAQVDVGADHDTHGLSGADIFVAAVALMHAPLVARQCLDRAQRAQFLEDVLRRFSQQGGLDRPEERRVGQESGRTCRSRWAQTTSKKKYNRKSYVCKIS